MIVVDASIVANAIGDDGDDGRRARAEMWRAGDCAAPDLVDVEAAAVLRKRWLAGSMPARRFRSALDDLRDLPVERYPARPFLPRLYELRANVTAYDAVYVALAEGLGCDLVTADARLAAAPGPRCNIRTLV